MNRGCLSVRFWGDQGQLCCKSSVLSAPFTLLFAVIIEETLDETLEETCEVENSEITSAKKVKKQDIRHSERTQSVIKIEKKESKNWLNEWDLLIQHLMTLQSLTRAAA